MKEKLHLGCGKTILKEWINLDIMKGQGVDIVADLEMCSEIPLPFEDNSIDEFYASHLIEHIHFTLPLMQELHRIAKNDSKAVHEIYEDVMRKRNVVSEMVVELRAIKPTRVTKKELQTRPFIEFLMV